MCKTHHFRPWGEGAGKHSKKPPGKGRKIDFDKTHNEGKGKSEMVGDVHHGEY